MKRLILLSSVMVLSLGALACSSDDDDSKEATPEKDPNMEVDGEKPPTKPEPPTMEKPDPEEEPKPLAEMTVAEIAAANSDFSDLVSALEAADLVTALGGKGPFTVFAPTNEAFAAFEKENPGVLGELTKEELTGVLTYHVISAQVLAADLVSGSIAETLGGGYVGITLGDDVLINEAVVTKPDIVGKNGVIHVIDRIMLPPSADVVDTAIAAGSFTKLAEALTTAELVETLKGEGPFTVFAPTDDAFAAFEEANPGVLASLTKEQLTDILLYHVTSGWVGAAALEDGMMVPTQLADKSLVVDLTDGVKINDSAVTTANVLTTNGVIHVIDTILLPPAE